MDNQIHGSNSVQWTAKVQALLLYDEGPFIKLVQIVKSFYTSVQLEIDSQRCLEKFMKMPFFQVSKSRKISYATIIILPGPSF